MEEEQVQEGQSVEGEGYQKDGKRKEERWNTKKNRGPNIQTITLGGLHKVQKAKKRKEKQKLRRKLGEMEIPVHGGWKRQTGPLPPHQECHLPGQYSRGAACQEVSGS